MDKATEAMLRVLERLDSMSQQEFEERYARARMVERKRDCQEGIASMTPLNHLEWIFPRAHGAHPTEFDRAFARVYYSHPLTWWWRLPTNMRYLLEPWRLTLAIRTRLRRQR